MKRIKFCFNKDFKYKFGKVTLVFDPKEESFFELNGAGGFILLGIKGGKDISRIVLEFERKYKVSHKKAFSTCNGFLRKLEKERVIKVIP